MKILPFLSLSIIGLLIVIWVNIMPISAKGDVHSPLKQELQENRQLWRSQQIKNYQYIYQQQCFCPPPSNKPLKVYVKNDKITQVIDLSNNQAISELTFPKTIEQLFNIIEQAINSNADEILVTYEPRLGYPTTVAIDYEKILADDEISYRVENLSKVN